MGGIFQVNGVKKLFQFHNMASCGAQNGVYWCYDAQGGGRLSRTILMGKGDSDGISLDSKLFLASGLFVNVDSDASGPLSRRRDRPSPDALIATRRGVPFRSAAVCWTALSLGAVLRMMGRRWVDGGGP